MVDYRQILSTKCIGIAGAGGLGSNCAVALARVGVGKLVIADFDVVSQGNSNRQYFFRDQIGEKKVVALRNNLLRIDPNVSVEAHDLKLGSAEILEIFKDCDVIVEAFDLAEMKQMLIETVLSEMPEMFIISGMGLAGWGNSNEIKCSKIDKLIICGDGQLNVSEHFPPLAPRVGMVANLQANQVLELLLGECIV